MKEVICEWLEEGFSNIDDVIKNKSKRENPVLPYIISDEEENVTPKPLFPLFIGDTELNSDFLVEYIEVIQVGLQQEKEVLKTTSDHKMRQSFYHDLSNGSKLISEIIYHRKNIFLGRVILPIFEMVDTYVSNWSPYYESVVEKNKLYQEAIEFRSSFPNNFSDQSVQMSYAERLERQIETTAIILKDKQCEVTSYLMTKYYTRKEVFTESRPKPFEEYIRLRTKFRNEKEFQSRITDYPDILDRLRKDLYIIEKTLDYNSYEESIILYNRSEDLSRPTKITQSNIKLSVEEFGNTKKLREYARSHMDFYFPFLKDRYSVSCINCSSRNSSIFIAGYGITTEEDINFNRKGLVLCWNIHKCGYPEKMYHMEEIVTCIAISKFFPSLIAVGMDYGLIAVIDLHKFGFVTNRFSTIRPTGAIKSIHWKVEKYSLNKEREIILALSIDGSITVWNLGSKLEGYLLKTIKREQIVPSLETKPLPTNALAGFCMHAKPDTETLFSVGTVDGHVLLVDFNHAEDNIQVKTCHSGVMNDVKWSPISADVFFTCGTDRCLHIWQLHKEKPSKTLVILDEVFAVALSEVKSTLFAALTKNKLYIYDLSSELHIPIIELKCDETSHYTFVTFCHRNNWILIGQDNGIVSLYEIVNLQKLESTKSNVLNDFLLPDQ